MFFALFITPVSSSDWGSKITESTFSSTPSCPFSACLTSASARRVTKHMSFYWGKKDFSALRTLIRTSNSLSLITAVLGMLLLIAIGYVGPHLLPAQFASYQAYSTSFLIAGLIFFSVTLITTYGTIMTALQRFDVSTKIGMASITTSSFAVLGVVLAGGSLTAIFLTQLIVIVVFNVVTVLRAQKILPEAAFRFGWDAQEIRHCYRFGLIAFVNGIAATALASLDRLIIPFYAGPSNLTYYSLPGSVTSRIPGVSNTLAITLFPTTSQLDGANNRLRIETLYIRSFRLITIAAAALCITSIAFAYKILLYWLNADFAAHSSEILVILALTNFLLALFGPLSSFLLGLNKIKFVTAMSLVMGTLNAVLLFILLPLYGITGAAWAYLLSVLPVIYIFYYAEKKYLTLVNRGHYYMRKITGTVVISIAVWFIDTYLLSPFIVNIATLLLVGGCSVVIYLILYKICGLFDPVDWADFEKFFGQIARKLKLKK